MTKKRGILLVALALVLATASVVYAHWTDTLEVDAVINTGDIDVIWQEYGTDDDGLDNTAFFTASTGSVADSATDDGLGTDYDAWVGTSSDDPLNMIRCTGGVCNYLGGAIDRYTKDVARCEVTASNEGKTLTATITDAYPSYHCSIFAQLSNEGTVPVKAAGFTLNTPVGGTLAYAGLEWVEATAGTTAWCNLPENAGKCPMGIFVGDVPVITFDIANGTMCGTQFDPWATTQDMDLQAYWFHVEQAAAQDASYTFSWEQEFVNWNEWSPEMCTITINGVTYP